MDFFKNFDDDCPYCDSRGKVEKYLKETSVFDELFQCKLCYEIFRNKSVNPRYINAEMGAMIEYRVKRNNDRVYSQFYSFTFK